MCTTTPWLEPPCIVKYECCALEAKTPSLAARRRHPINTYATNQRFRRGHCQFANLLIYGLSINGHLPEPGQWHQRAPSPPPTNSPAPTRNIEAMQSAADSGDHADVIGISVSGEPGSYRFSLTVRSPDTGWDRYADLWEVVPSILVGLLILVIMSTAMSWSTMPLLSWLARRWLYPVK